MSNIKGFIALIVDTSDVCPLAFVRLACIYLDDVKALESRILKITDFFVYFLGIALHYW